MDATQLDPTFVLAWTLSGALVAVAIIGIIVQTVNRGSDPRHGNRPPDQP